MHIHTKREIKIRLGHLHRSSDAPYLLKGLGIKATAPRVRILAFLSEKGKPMTVEHIFSKMKPKLDIVTIYRNLETFEKARLVKRLNISGPSVFFEINDHHHHHIVCNDCGKIEELEDCDIRQPLPKTKKFKVVFDHSLEFFGRCRTCVTS